VANEVIYIAIAVGVTEDGYREILGFYAILKNAHFINVQPDQLRDYVFSTPKIHLFVS
jgi:hypothetical protein